MEIPETSKAVDDAMSPLVNMFIGRALVKCTETFGELSDQEKLIIIGVAKATAETLLLCPRIIIDRFKHIPEMVKAWDDFEKARGEMDDVQG